MSNQIDNCRGKYPGHDFTLLWARRPGDTGLETDVDGIVQAIVPPAPTGPAEWQGDNTAWDQAFATLTAEVEGGSGSK